MSRRPAPSAGFAQRLASQRLACFLALLLGIALAPAPASADIVGVIDPPGGGEIEEEIGNISEAAFEALGPIVNDHENGTGPQGADSPFFIGSVMVTGQYGLGAAGTGTGTGNPWVLANLSGNRRSFTVSGVDARDNTPAGTWMYADEDPGDNRNNYVQFNLTPTAGGTVVAVGLAWMGRDNRAGDSPLTATVTFADGATITTAPLVLDGDGDGLPNGKDVFIGFEDTGSHGGIARLEVWIVHPALYFHGWDDIGVVLAGDGACCSDGPGTASECSSATLADCEASNGLFLGAGSDCATVLDCVPLLAVFDSMSAAAMSDGVLVQWATSIEIDTVGFRVLRESATSREKGRHAISSLIPAAGNTVTGATYRFFDNTGDAASDVYYIEDIDVYGRATLHGPIAVERPERQRMRSEAPRTNRAR